MKSFFTILLILLSYSSIHSQIQKSKHVMHVHKNIYRYGTEFIEFGDMNTIFQQDSTALRYFRKAKVGKVIGTVFGTLALGYLAATVPVLASNSSDELIGVAVLFAFGCVSILGSIGLTSRSFGLKSMDKAMDRLNSLYLDDLGMIPEKSSITFGIKSSSVGFTFSF